MYVKQFDSEGNLLNPITKENPFLVLPKERKVKTRLKNKMIVTMVGNTSYKYLVRLQKVKGKIIEHYHLVSSHSLPMNSRVLK